VWQRHLLTPENVRNDRGEHRWRCLQCGRERATEFRRRHDCNGSQWHASQYSRRQVRDESSSAEGSTHGFARRVLSAASSHVVVQGSATSAYYEYGVGLVLSAMRGAELHERLHEARSWPHGQFRPVSEGLRIATNRPVVRYVNAGQWPLGSHQ